MSLFDPLLHNVPGDLHSSLGHLILAPFASDFLGPGHVDFFGNEYPKWGKPLMLHQKLRSGPGDDILIHGAQPFGEGRSGQSNDFSAGVFYVFNCLLTHHMALVHDQQVQLRKVLHALKSLSRADLQSLGGIELPMTRLEHAMI